MLLAVKSALAQETMIAMTGSDIIQVCPLTAA